MDIATLIIIIICVYYTKYFTTFFNKDNRKFIKTTNKKLDKLRVISHKTLKKQKEFLNLRYPKSQFKLTWKTVPFILFHLAIYIALFQVYNYLFEWLGWKFRLWHAILVVFLFPVLINILLRRFGLNKQDISVFFRRYKK